MRALFALAAAGLLAFAVSACGSSSSSAAGGRSSAASGSDAAGVTQAKQNIAEARKPPKFVPPGPAFDATKASGKTVYVIANTLSIPFTATFVANLKEGLSAAHVKLIALDMKSDVSEAARLVAQAVSVNADLIVVQKPQAKLIAAPLAKAKAAGIPVIEVFEADPRLPPESQKALGVTAEVSYPWTQGGRLLADYVIADSGGKGKGVTYYSSDNVDSGLLRAGQQSEFAKLCHGCDMEYRDVLQSQWTDRLPTMTASDLAKDYVYYTPHFDGMLTFMEPAMRQVNALSRLKLASFNADLPQMKDLKAGTVKLLVGSPTSWLGYGVADQALRILSGQKPVADENIALRVFDSTNIGSVDISKPEAAWYVTDFKGAYKKLWGVG